MSSASPTDSPAGWCWLWEHIQLHPHGVREGACKCPGVGGGSCQSPPQTGAQALRWVEGPARVPHRLGPRPWGGRRFLPESPTDWGPSPGVGGESCQGPSWTGAQVLGWVEGACQGLLRTGVQVLGWVEGTCQGLPRTGAQALGWVKGACQGLSWTGAQAILLHWHNRHERACSCLSPVLFYCHMANAALP